MRGLMVLPFSQASVRFRQLNHFYSFFWNEKLPLLLRMSAQRYSASVCDCEKKSTIKCVLIRWFWFMCCYDSIVLLIDSFQSVFFPICFSFSFFCWIQPLYFIMIMIRRRREKKIENILLVFYCAKFENQIKRPCEHFILFVHFFIFIWTKKKKKYFKMYFFRQCFGLIPKRFVPMKRWREKKGKKTHLVDDIECWHLTDFNDRLIAWFFKSMSNCCSWWLAFSIKCQFLYGNSMEFIKKTTSDCFISIMAAPVLLIFCCFVFILC